MSQIIEELSEDDIVDVISDIYNMIEDMYSNNIIELSSPTFYEDIYSSISSVFYTEWMNFGIISNDNTEDMKDSAIEFTSYYDDIYDFVEETGELFFDFSGYLPRSKSYEGSIIELDQDAIIAMKDKIHILKSIKQPVQRTTEWYEFRHNLISASNIHKAFGTESQQNQLIYEKCHPLNYNSMYSNNLSLTSSLHWGVKYEPLTVMLYEHLFHTKIEEFGCIQHPEYPFIGASPDGIVTDPMSSRFGRMIEIKNIVNREITGIPKKEYWIQTQVQMEVCDLDYCDFMETAFKEYQRVEDFKNDTEHEFRGVILHFIEIDSTSPTVNVPVYKYMPFDISLEEESIQQWIQETRDSMKSNGRALFNTIYWYLEEYSCVLIQRNKDWFKAALPLIENCWKTIEKERVDGYQHRASKKKELNNTIVTSDSSSNTYVIKNMKQNNNICLVKLDHC